MIADGTGKTMANPNPEIKHLVATQFKPGHKPPPGSGGQKRPVSKAYAELMKTKAPPDIIAAMSRFGCKANATWADVLACALAREGLKGSVFATKELREGIEGRAPQRIELLAREDCQLDINVTFENLLGTHKPVEVIDVDVQKELPDPGDGEAEKE